MNKKSAARLTGIFAGLALALSLTACGGGGGGGGTTPPPANKVPVASFTKDKTGGTAPVTVAFNSTSTDSDGNVVGCVYTFSDGVTLGNCNDTRTFSAAGTFTVTLKVTDNDGAVSAASAAQTITVTAAVVNPMAGICDILPDGQNRNYIGTAKTDQKYDAGSCRRPPTASADLAVTSRIYKADGTTTPAYLVPNSATGKAHKIVFCLQDTFPDTDIASVADYQDKVLTECVIPLSDVSRQIFSTNVFVYNTRDAGTYGASPLRGEMLTERWTVKTICNAPVINNKADDRGVCMHEKEVNASSSIVPEGGLYLQGLTGMVADGKQFSDPVGGADKVEDTTSAGVYKFTRTDGRLFNPGGSFSPSTSLDWNPLIMYRRGLISLQQLKDLIPGTMRGFANLKVVDFSQGLWSVDAVKTYTAEQLADYANANAFPASMQGAPDPAYSVRIEDTLMIVAIKKIDFTTEAINQMVSLVDRNVQRLANGTNRDGAGPRLTMNIVQPDAIFLSGVTVRAESP